MIAWRKRITSIGLVDFSHACYRTILEQEVYSEERSSQLDAKNSIAVGPFCFAAMVSGSL